MAVIVRSHHLPKTHLSQDEAYKTILAELKQYEKDVLLDFQATTGTWKHKVKWQHEHLILPDVVSVKVWTTDEIYKYVDEGTKPHIISPKNKPRLAFMVGGSPKTQPGMDTAGPGSPGTKLVVLPVGMSVHHPGTKARNFTKEIRKHHSKDFYSRIDKAMRKWIRTSGFAAK